MTLDIYNAYIAMREKLQEGKINLSEEESKVMAHKSNITMDMILMYMHEGKDEDEDINIEDFKFIEFVWWIQNKLKPDDSIK